MKKILYVFDDINYESGARNATFYQIKCLKKYCNIHILSLSRPLKTMEISPLLLKTEILWKNMENYVKSLKCVINEQNSWKQKWIRILYSIALRMGKGDSFLEKNIYKNIAVQMEKYDAVIVVSEASKLRKTISKLKNPKKIQWIHTDYKLWSEFSNWTRAVTRYDKEIYDKYDCIVTLSEKSKAGMLEKIPELREKIVVIPNLVDFQRIRENAKKMLDVQLPKRDFRFITVGRIDKEKNFEGILDVCEKLKNDGIDFCWIIVGDGPLFQNISKTVKEKKLENCVFLLGRKENPYPIMRQCDFLVLLSKYEGTPVTIDEAAVLGIPVVATAVGGIPEQIERYGNGQLIQNGNDVYEIFKDVIMKKDKFKTNIFMEDMNEMCLKQILSILEQ